MPNLRPSLAQKPKDAFLPCLPEFCPTVTVDWGHYFPSWLTLGMPLKVFASPFPHRENKDAILIIGRPLPWIPIP